jgi:hypothetical protein
MAEGDVMEKRQQHRQRVARPARLMFGGSGSMPCSICDVSRFGAGLEVHGAHAVVNAFDLQDVMSGIIRTGVVVWRDGARIGVRFAGESEWPHGERRARRSAFGRRAS